MAMMPRLPAVASGSLNEPTARSRWDKMVTTTPVLLTVLATVLAGISSSEMIQAQYHRSLAAQNQSKAGDQWAFFQAKRTRSTIITRTLDLFAGSPQPIAPKSFEADMGRIVSSLSDAAQPVRELAAAANQALDKLGPAAKPIEYALTLLSGLGEPNTVQTYLALQKQTVSALERPDVQTALTFLGNERLPPAPGTTKPAPAVEVALRAFADHRPEAELTGLVNAIDDATLDREVLLAEQSARALEDAGKSVDGPIRELDELNRQAMRMIRSFHRSAAALDDAVAGLESVGAAELVRAKAREIGRIDHALARALDDLQDFHAAREDYTSRRMDREADANRTVAGLYELRVEKSSLNSERHRRRSKNFFYGMLCAQAGVAMSSFALAARHRSGLWSLAGMAGLGALIFSGYVYLYV